MRSRIDTALAEVPRRMFVETTMSHIACKLVAEGLGISIVDPCTAMEFRGQGITVKPFALHIESGFVSLLPMQRPVGAPTTAFMSELEQYITEKTKL